MEKRLKIIAVINSASIGGAQKIITTLVVHLRKRHHQVELCYLDHGEGRQSEIGNTSTLFHKTPDHFHQYVIIFIKLILKLRASRPDIVISFLPRANILTQLASIIAKVPVRIASQRNPCWSYGRVVRAMDKLLGSMGVYTCNIAVSRTAAKSFENYPRTYKRLLQIIPNGIKPLQTTLSKEQVCQKFTLPLNRPKLVILGRLTDQKNHETVIRALKKVGKAHLIIAGDGVLRPELEELTKKLELSDRVSFLGAVSVDDVPLLLKAADIFLMPSIYEGMSNSLLEAMSLGLPIIASDIDAIKELLQDEGGDVGILIPAKSVGSWSRSIAQLIQDKKQLDILGKRALNRSREFTTQLMVDKYEEIMLRLNHQLNGLR